MKTEIELTTPRARLRRTGSMMLTVGVLLAAWFVATDASPTDADGRFDVLPVCVSGGLRLRADVDASLLLRSTPAPVANDLLRIDVRARTGAVVGPWLPLPQQPSYLFDQANGFTLSASLDLTASVQIDALQVRITAGKAWHDGAAGGQQASSPWTNVPTPHCSFSPIPGLPSVPGAPKLPKFPSIPGAGSVAPVLAVLSHTVIETVGSGNSGGAATAPSLPGVGIGVGAGAGVKIGGGTGDGGGTGGGGGATTVVPTTAPPSTTPATTVPGTNAADITVDADILCAHDDDLADVTVEVGHVLDHTPVSILNPVTGLLVQATAGPGGLTATIHALPAGLHLVDVHVGGEIVQTLLAIPCHLLAGDLVDVVCGILPDGLDIDVDARIAAQITALLHLEVVDPVTHQVFALADLGAGAHAHLRAIVDLSLHHDLQLRITLAGTNLDLSADLSCSSTTPSTVRPPPTSVTPSSQTPNSVPPTTTPTDGAPTTTGDPSDPSTTVPGDTSTTVGSDSDDTHGADDPGAVNGDGSTPTSNVVKGEVQEQSPAAATATPVAASGSLPITGSDSMRLAGLALLLIGGGSAVLLASRRTTLPAHRTTGTDDPSER